MLLATIAFVFVAPMGLAAVPLAILALVVRPRTRAVAVLGIAGAAIGVLWLIALGDLPDQVARAAALIGGVVFAAACVFSRRSFTFRAVFTAVITALAVAILLAAQGTTWTWLHFVTMREIGFELQAGARLVTGGNLSKLQEFAPTMYQITVWLALIFPVILALQFIGGLLLATSLIEHVAPGSTGRPPGRFRDFTFSEHLGWVAVVPAVWLIWTYGHHADTALALLERARPIDAAAFAALGMMAVFYGLRGLAVIAFAVRAEHNLLLSVFTWLTILFALFLLPLTAGGAILLGLLDSVLDIRRRWLTPPPVGA